MAKLTGKARALANQERAANAERASRLGRTAVLTIATVLSFVTLSLLIADQLYRPESFVIDQLKIKGSFRHLDPEAIKELVRGHDTSNFFAVDLAKIKEEIETHAWVREAQVRREWPDTLMIRIQEHRPVAKWKENKWVNTQGQVVDLPFNPDGKQIIHLNGQEPDAKLMLSQTIVWKRQLIGDGLVLRRIDLSGSHAWTLHLYYPSKDFEFTLLLGREDIEERLARFQNLFDKRFKQSNEQLQRVDARYPDGLAITSKPLPDHSDLTTGIFSGQGRLYGMSEDFNSLNSSIDMGLETHLDKQVRSL